MSTATPTVDVSRRADDHTQTLVAVETAGVRAVVAVEHGAAPAELEGVLADAAAEIAHQAQLDRSTERDGNGGQP